MVCHRNKLKGRLFANSRQLCTMLPEHDYIISIDIINLGLKLFLYIMIAIKQRN